MTVAEFKAWFDGFTHGKAELQPDAWDVVRAKIPPNPLRQQFGITGIQGIHQSVPGVGQNGPLVQNAGGNWVR